MSSACTKFPTWAAPPKAAASPTCWNSKQARTSPRSSASYPRTDGNKEDITWQQPGFLFFATQQGTVKKTPLEDFANVRKGGIIAIGIEAGDTLIDVKLTSGQ